MTYSYATLKKIKNLVMDRLTELFTLNTAKMTSTLVPVATDPSDDQT